MPACLRPSRGTAAGSERATPGILAALGAAVLWGTVSIPCRKAYISGMNPLSLALIFHGGFGNLLAELASARPAQFWLFLGGFSPH